MEPSSETIPAPGTRLSRDGTTATAGDLELHVSKVKDVDAKGATLTVTGRGYDTFKGIYVAFCKAPKAGRVPSPCGGGATTAGSTGASQWISSNPPPYGRGLTIPYQPDGSFTTTVHVEAKLARNVDCREVQCVVGTRNDHTRSTDRSQDVLVPVTFTGGRLASASAADRDASSGTGAAIPIAIGAVVVVAAFAVGIALFRRKRRDASTAGPSSSDVPVAHTT